MLKILSYPKELYGKGTNDGKTKLFKKIKPTLNFCQLKKKIVPNLYFII